MNEARDPLLTRWADAWEPVWPGAGVHEFDGGNRDIRTGESLQSLLDALDRLAGRAAKH